MSSATTLEVIGGQGGGPFSLTGENNGASLEKIQVWVREWQVKAVKVLLSDGRSQTFGEPSGSHQEYIFQPDECFTALSLWGNGEGTRLGAIKFKTNKGGDFFAKMTNCGLKKEYSIDVGSGCCLGVVGRGGADIDCMGFMFLNEVQSVVLTNVKYPNTNLLRPNVTVEEFKSITYTNDSSATHKQKIEASKKLIKQSSWSISVSLTAKFSLEVKAVIPEPDDSDGLFIGFGSERTYSQQHTDEETENFCTTMQMPPKMKLDVNITIRRVTYDLPYTGTVKITCNNGSVLQYETKGQYKGVNYTNVKMKTSLSNL